jgi:hypothetical protein
MREIKIDLVIKEIMTLKIQTLIMISKKNLSNLIITTTTEEDTTTTVIIMRTKRCIKTMSIMKETSKMLTTISSLRNSHSQSRGIGKSLIFQKFNQKKLITLMIKNKMRNIMKAKKIQFL